KIICQEREYPAARIFRRPSVVLQPMPEHRSPGLEDFHIEGMVSARIGDEADGRSRISPVRQRPCAVVGGCPVVELTDDNERRYAWTGANHATAWIEGDGRAIAEIARVDEELDRALLCHRQG